MICCRQFVIGWVWFVCLEDALLVFCQKIATLIFRPFNELDRFLLRTSYAPVNPMICEENHVGPCKDCIHVVLRVNGSKWRLDQVQQVFGSRLPVIAFLHLLIQVIVKFLVVWVVTCLSTCRSLEVCWWVSGPNGGVFFLNFLVLRAQTLGKEDGKTFETKSKQSTSYTNFTNTVEGQQGWEMPWGKKHHSFASAHHQKLRAWTLSKALLWRNPDVWLSRLMGSILLQVGFARFRTWIGQKGWSSMPGIYQYGSCPTR